MESDGDEREAVSVTTGPSASCAVLSAMTKEATLFVRAHKEKQVETLLVPERNAGEGGR